MKIAICDDEPVIIEELTRMTEEYFLDHGIDITIRSFTSAEGLLTSSTHFDLLLLDCMLPGVDGIELARRIRAKHPLSEIIFISAYSDYIFESYDVSHLRYILKPVAKEQLTKTFDDYFSILNDRRPIFVMADLSIPMNEIYYITSRKNNTSVRTADTVYNATGTLKEIEKELNPDSFMCITRGTIIGFAHIERYKDGHLVMTDRAEFNVARRKKNDFMLRFTKYLNSHH